MNTSSSWERSIALLERLPTMPSAERVEAVAQLVRSASPMVRERALRTGAVVVSDELIEAYLRSDADDVARNAGLEMLKLRGSRGVSLAIRLLRDDDPDVVLQAVLALGHTRDLRALEPLRGSLGHEDPNVVQAAIEAVGRLGDARAVADLVPFLQADPWLQMAAIQALGELRDRGALDPLAALLSDLLVGPLVAEAIARIGGTKAYRLLAHHLVRFGGAAEAEGLIALLAHVLEGLRGSPATIDGLRAILTAAVDAVPDERPAGTATANSFEASALDEAGAFAAARCLLCLAPAATDRAAIRALAAAEVDPLHVPTCLDRRADLVPELLSLPGAPRCWGFLMLERHPRAASDEQILAAIEGDPPRPELLKAATRALSQIQRRQLASGLLRHYASSSPEIRRVLAPLVATQSRHLGAALLATADLEIDDQLLLAARAGARPTATARAIEQLPARRRAAVLEQLVDLPEFTRDLPWRDWLEEDPDLWLELTALVAGRLGLRDLGPLLRQRLAGSPSPALLRALGDLGDRESLSTLNQLLQQNDPRVVPLVLETVGRIGGPEAREILRRVISVHGPDERMAYRALSICATPDDDHTFRAAVHHNDWYVRLACAEVLGRFSRPENLEALAQLASDPVPLVAQRAVASIER